MPFQRNHWQLGEIVYPQYLPSQVGVVVKVSGDSVTILTKKGEYLTDIRWGFKLYESLIDEHRRKARNHSKVLEEMKVLSRQLEKAGEWESDAGSEGS